MLIKIIIINIIVIEMIETQSQKTNTRLNEIKKKFNIGIS